MNKTQLTHKLEKELWKHTKKRGTFGCFEVTIGWYGKERIDYLTYNTKDIFRCYEIKASKAHFYSNSTVSFVGHYNYYVMPIELYKEVKEDIDSHIGVFVSDGKKLSKSKKKAYQNYKQHMELRKKLYEKYGESWKEGI